MIIIFEPQCVGFEHTEVNAAMIAIIKNAFRNEDILFIGEKEHLKLVKKILDRRTIYINYREIIIPPKDQSNIRRFRLEYKNVKKVFNLARLSGAHKILFSSVTSPTLISIKVILRDFKELKVIVVPHSILERVKSILYLLYETIFWFRFWISFFNMDNLRYLVLGPSIEKELLKKLPHIRKYVCSIDHPYFFLENKITKLNEDCITFGFLGVGIKYKGIDQFFKLAEDTGETNSKFLLVGQLMEEIPEASEKHVQLLSSDAPLSRKDYEEYIKDIDYAVFLYRKEKFRFIASGTLFDAFSNLKPIIALRSPYFEHYFNIMGDIGYLCDSYGEMKETIHEILNNKPKQRYIAQQLNILKGRKKISIDQLSRDFLNLDIWK